VKRLLILRHAKSSWSSGATDDWHRPLNHRGERDAPRAGAWLKDRSRVPDLIITSDAVRARTTAEAAARAAGYTGEIVIEPALYHATPDALIAVLNGIGNDDARTVMIVGHNPGLEALVSQLSGEDHRLVTTGLVELSVPMERWSDLDLTAAASIAETWEPSAQ
jgi:phosphohistidine phosphatase